MDKKKIYSTLIFIKNTLKLDKDNFILDVFDINEDCDTIERFYKYLKNNKIINSEQDLEFKLVIRAQEYELYTLGDVFGIITNIVTPQKDEWEKMGTLNEDEAYAALSGFLENEKDILNSLLKSVEDELAENGLSFEYLKTLIPEVEIPKIKEQECSQVISVKNYDMILNGIETMQELLDNNMSEDDIKMFKCILNTMTKAIQGI